MINENDNQVRVDLAFIRFESINITSSLWLWVRQATTRRDKQRRMLYCKVMKFAREWKRSECSWTACRETPTNSHSEASKMPAVKDCGNYTRLLLDILSKYNISIDEEVQSLSNSTQDDIDVNNRNNKTDINEDQIASRLHEFQVIKAVVLASVTIIILVSVCKMIFQLFIRYPSHQDKWLSSKYVFF